MEITAKLFMKGRSQAVRLPESCRFEGEEVRIRKVGETVILEPIIRRQWPEDFFAQFTEDPDFPEITSLPDKPFDLSD
jgi:virulence-associated protein VagC